MEMSARVYSVMLRLYPQPLRERFGEDMVAVFRQQLIDEYGGRGLAGLATAWLCVAGDLAENTAGERLNMRPMAVFAAAIVASLALFEGVLRVTALSGHGR